MKFVLICHIPLNQDEMEWNHLCQPSKKETVAGQYIIDLFCTHTHIYIDIDIYQDVQTGLN